MRRAPLRRQSKKRQAEAQQRRRVVDEVMRRANFTCQARDVVPEVECDGGLDCDELAPRGVYPGGHLDVDNCHALCRTHHNWKHDNPKEAARRGLRLWSWEPRAKKAAPPFQTRRNDKTRR